MELSAPGRIYSPFRAIVLLLSVHCLDYVSGYASLQIGPQTGPSQSEHDAITSFSICFPLSSPPRLLCPEYANSDSDIDEFVRCLLSLHLVLCG